MKPRPHWQEKRRADAEVLAELRDAKPVTCEEFAAEARAKDEVVLAAVRDCLARYPEHSNVPLWRAVIERGEWGTAEWREAAARTVPSSEREPVTAQGRLF